MPATTLPAPEPQPGERGALPAPFCRLTTTASGGAWPAMSSAIPGVSPLLTVTSTTSAPAKAAAGRSSRRRREGRIWFAAVEVGDREPFATASAIRGRASSVTLAGQRQAAADIAADAAGAGNDDGSCCRAFVLRSDPREPVRTTARCFNGPAKVGQMSAGKFTVRYRALRMSERVTWLRLSTIAPAMKLPSIPPKTSPPSSAVLP